MQLIAVRSKKEWRLFHRVPHLVYKNDPYWICPLEKDVEKIFSPEHNRIFQNGEAVLYVLLDDHKKPVGRIAAFIDHSRNAQQDYPVGGMGFFECIDNEGYADALLTAAEAYLYEKGMKAIDGPVNFGERDKFWGLLSKGHGLPPIYQENYQPAYYGTFLKKNGYRPHEQVLTLKGAVDDIPYQRMHAIAERLRRRHPIEVKSLDIDRLDLAASAFTEVYNVAFCDFPYFKPLENGQILELFQQAKAIIDPNIICMAYHEDQPIGFCALLPEINPFLTHARGKLNLWTLPPFLYKFKTAKKRIAKGVAFGIHPDFQQKGIFPIMVDHLANIRQNITTYSHIVLATIRGHNTIMVQTTQNLGVQIERVHIAYRKMLDPDLAFEPLEFMDV